MFEEIIEFDEKKIKERGGRKNFSGKLHSRMIDTY